MGKYETVFSNNNRKKGENKINNRKKGENKIIQKYSNFFIYRM